MDTLPHRHLTTLTLDVDFAGVVSIGAVPGGRRGIAPVRGGRFEGARLAGSVAPGHDWFVTRDDGALAIDVRLTLITNDGAAIYLFYTGLMLAAPDAMARFRRGEVLPRPLYSLRVTGRFESGDDRYRWVNDSLAVGIGEQTATGPIYRFFEIG